METITTERLNQYRQHLFDEEKAPATIEKYVRDILGFMSWLCGRSIDKSTVLAYKRFLLENYAPRSVNSMISSLNHFFHFNGWFSCKIKAVKIQRQIFASQEKELAKTDYQKLLKAARDTHKDRLFYVMQTICATGIRISELRHISVAAVKSGKAEIRCKGKIRTVLLPKQLCQALAAYIKKYQIKEGSVFVTKSGRTAGSVEYLGGDESPLSGRRRRTEQGVSP